MARPGAQWAQRPFVQLRLRGIDANALPGAQRHANFNQRTLEWVVVSLNVKNHACRLPDFPLDRFAASIAFTLFAMFAVGASRALIARVRWWTAGVEMLGLGAVVAALAYGSGTLVAALVDRG